MILSDATDPVPPVCAAFAYLACRDVSAISGSRSYIYVKSLAAVPRAF